jgi:hypothetical protein
MLRFALLVAVAALPLSAGAQSYRCVGADGKKYYGQSVPPQCVGQVVEQLNAQGSVVKRIDAQASAEQRAKKEAEDAEGRKRAAQAKDQGRRDQALLATYTSEKDVESARGRALEDNKRLVKELQERIAALKARRTAAKTAKDDLPAIDSELKMREEMLAGRQKEAQAINARYDEDKKRYVEITTRGK